MRVTIMSFAKLILSGELFGECFGLRQVSLCCEMEKKNLATDTRLGAFAIADPWRCPMSTNHWSL